MDERKLKQFLVEIAEEQASSHAEPWALVRARLQTYELARRSRQKIIIARTSLTLAVLALIFAVLLVVSPDVRAEVARLLNPAPDFGSELYGDRLNFEQAQARLPFQALKPAVLPPGYGFVFALLPRNDPSHALFVYSNTGRPSPNLEISQALVNQRVDCERALGQGILSQVPKESLVINGNPAVYSQAGITQKPNDPTDRLDFNLNSLAVEYPTVCVQLFGQVDAGVDRAMLIQIASSLH